jgi:hypothetical protein
MDQSDSQPEADAYYGNEEIDGGEIDLSFLDDDKE